MFICLSESLGLSSRTGKAMALASKFNESVSAQAFESQSPALAGATSTSLPKAWRESGWTTIAWLLVSVCLSSLSQHVYIFYLLVSIFVLQHVSHGRSAARIFLACITKLIAYSAKAMSRSWK